MDVYLDFETRSTCDIKRGVDCYASHESTSILCLAHAVGDEPVQVWIPGESDPPWLGAVADGSARLHAHNARFERLIWHYHLRQWPRPKLSQWWCTAAQAAAAGLPRALGRAAIACGLEVQKDTEGKRLVKKLCCPRKPSLGQIGIWCNDPYELDRLYAYCARDVEVERALAAKLPPLADRERTTWLLDQVINDRGVAVDLPLIAAVLQVGESHQRLLGERLRTLTGGAVTGGQQVARLLAWLETQGVYAINLTSETVESLLRDDTLTSEAREVLEIRRQLGRASVAKYLAFAERTSTDGRLRGSHLYFGAKTGRWAGSGVQLQNIPRGSLKAEQIEPAVQAVRAGYATLRREFADVSGTLSSLIRPMLVARPRHRLIVVDFAGVEARVLPWLAGQRDLVQQFVDGADTYKTLAATIYGCDVAAVTKDQRQVGKMARLGLGYSMGAEKFAAACAKAGVTLDAEFCQRVVTTYREASAQIVGWWRDLERAAITCVKTGAKQKVSGCVWYRHGDWLLARLASGRPVPYYMPSLQKQQTKFGAREALAYLAESSVTRKFQVERTYGGKLAENVVQATCRDLLCDALLRLETRGYRVVMHIHDEVVVEHPEDQGSLSEVESIVAEVPTWARGCPIGVEGFESRRYRK